MTSHRTDIDPNAPRTTRPVHYLLGLLRLSIGWTFLWAFLDKTFGLDFSTPSAESWLDGGSPTTGYLDNATSGPLADFYQSLSGQAWVDWLFMIGLLGVGLALMLGVGVRIAAVAGALMLVMMWSAALWPETNPFMDYHLTESFALGVLALTSAGRYLGLGGVWEKVPFVAANRWLI